jgi:hypothetical protein
VPAARFLADQYRRFASSDAAAASPLTQRLAVALSESAALRAVEAAPARKRNPALILAALHDLALAGRAPELAAAFAAGDGDAAGRAAVQTLLRETSTVVAVVQRRRIPADEAGRFAVLHPLIAEVARRGRATTLGLIDVGRPAGLNLLVDRVGVTYGGRSLGDPSSTVQLSAEVVGDRPVPAHPMPEVVARVVLDPDPLDVTDADDVRWLRACLPPDRPDRRAELDAQLELAATDHPTLLPGDPVDLLPDAVARVPSGALPVVLTTWALSRLSAEQRQRFLHHLTQAAADRPVAWVSAEGVGVAPAIPTFGDRPASGHSILGLALVDGTARRVEAVGRCWSRGRLLSWLAP